MISHTNEMGSEILSIVQVLWSAGFLQFWTPTLHQEILHRSRPSNFFSSFFFLTVPKFHFPINDFTVVNDHPVLLIITDVSAMGTRQIWICLDSSVYTRGASWLALIGYLNPGSNRGACTRVWYDKATKSAQVTLPPVYPPTRQGHTQVPAYPANLH